MALQRLVFDVYLEPDVEGDPPLEHRVEVRHGDMLRGELECGKQGIGSPKVVPLAVTTVWVWCALAREGIVSVPFQEFREKVIQLAAVKDAPHDGAMTDGNGAVEVPPTMPDLSGLPSPSLITSEAGSPTGSTPTSTND